MTLLLILFWAHYIQLSCWSGRKSLAEEMAGFTEKPIYTQFCITCTTYFGFGSNLQKLWWLMLSKEIFVEMVGLTPFMQMILTIITGSDHLNVDTHIYSALFNFSKIFNKYSNFYICFINPVSRCSQKIKTHRISTWSPKKCQSRPKDYVKLVVTFSKAHQKLIRMSFSKVHQKLSRNFFL